MDIGQVFQTLIGTVVGGSIVIATNWINALRERKLSTQQWYEDLYIAKGLDPIITYLTGQEYRLLVSDQIASSIPTDQYVVPLDALTRIQTLLDSQVLTKIIGLLQIIPARGGAEAMLLVAVNNVEQELLSFRKELLKAIPTKVNNKNYEIDASGIRDRLDAIQINLRSFAKQSHL
jgi:hypothetical protein